MRKISTSLKTFGPLAAVCAGALALGACQAGEEDSSDAETEEAGGIAIDLPKAPMTDEASDGDAMDDEGPDEDVPDE